MNLAESSQLENFQGASSKKVVYPAPTLEQFDLKQYLDEYSSNAKIKRAIYMAEHCTSLAVECYKIAFAELRSKTLDTKLYEEVWKRLRQLGVDVEKDTEWAEQTRNESSRKCSDLRSEVAKFAQSGQKTDALKTQQELARLLVQMGRGDEAIRAWQDTREYCINIHDQAQLSVEAAKINQSVCRWMQVSSFTQRAVQTLAKSVSEKMQSNIDVLQLQASVGDGRWTAAVGSLRTLKYDNVSSCDMFTSGAVAPQDVALYGALAGLAALKRDSIKTDLINNVEFGKYLDHMPECARLLRCFYASRYSECLERLDKLLSLVALDPVLGPHVGQLRTTIRENIVVLYTQPFVSSNLASMAQALRFDSTADLEELLVKLIERRLISARIDGTSGYLVKYTANPRDTALETIDRMYRSLSLQSDAMLARIQFLEEETGKPRK
ncbi:cop9 signalosome complex subunit [Coemansia sp. RSA 1722]|nr:cop9 signalosome complex subunit [Coemansia sp. RSA 485]KAJ2606856.1 cop9 signalosome complex subunit [Coemansia sp. RSA 1722]